MKLRVAKKVMQPDARRIYRESTITGAYRRIARMFRQLPPAVDGLKLCAERVRYRVAKGLA